MQGSNPDLRRDAGMVDNAGCLWGSELLTSVKKKPGGSADHLRLCLRACLNCSRSSVGPKLQKKLQKNVDLPVEFVEH